MAEYLRCFHPEIGWKTILTPVTGNRPCMLPESLQRFGENGLYEKKLEARRSNPVDAFGRCAETRLPGLPLLVLANGTETPRCYDAAIGFRGGWAR
jgi:hypothetical protein